MSPGPTFDRIYPALKQRLVTGDYAPGDHLEPSAIGEQMFSSLTPVRDALHRLVGERIVEAPRNDGFRVPRPTEAELRTMYRWRSTLLDLALRSTPPPVLAPPPPPPLAGHEIADPILAARALFDVLGGRARSREIEAAIANISDRLGLIGRAEGKALPEALIELEQLQTHFQEKDWPTLRKALAQWHRKRLRLVPAVLELAGNQRTIFE